MFLKLRRHQQPGIVKIYLFVKDLLESTYHLLINGREKIRIRILKNPKVFVVYSQTFEDVYENLESYNPTEKKKVLIVFNDMIADIEANKKLSHIVTELFLRERKLNISPAFYRNFISKCLKI